MGNFLPLATSALSFASCKCIGLGEDGELWSNLKDELPIFLLIGTIKVPLNMVPKPSIGPAFEANGSNPLRVMLRVVESTQVLRKEGSKLRSHSPHQAQPCLGGKWGYWISPDFPFTCL
ncbi:hypothetical protein AMTR_s00072p00154690 [Amborella trichopoda]|uniref:Uncharacterized protein n=1 Tax=Amborella trichopoda TaxID=13333 RepID=W1NPB8_AMBTC|nr:hypothetical protein AMTR_s00072p00154690 [Amborella trichopoda]